MARVEKIQRVERIGCDCNVIHEDVVAKVKKELKTEEEYLSLAEFYKIFGDGTRMKILHALESAELCVCDLAVLLSMTKSAISHQLKTLRMARLVKFRKEGQTCYYSLSDDHIKKIIDMGVEHIEE